MKKYLLPLFALVFILSGCVKYEEVKFKGIKHIQVKKMNKDGVELEVEAAVFNPNDYNISIVDSDLNLFMNKQEMGKATITDKIVLKKNAEEVYKFTVKGSADQALAGGISGLFTLIAGKSAEIHIKGTVKAKARFVSRTFPVDMVEKLNI